MIQSASKTFELFDKYFNPQNAKCYKICENKIPLTTEVVDFDTIKYENDCEIGYVVQAPYVVIDIDNKDDARKIWMILNQEKVKYYMNITSKGAHFIFKDSKGIVPQIVKKPTPIGIEIDTRVANKGYIILPENQLEKNRKWHPDGDKFDGIVSEIPYFLLPQKHLKDVKNFTNMLESSRNNDLYEHYMKLGNYSNDLTVEQIEKSIRLINKYIFKDPLSDVELNNTVLREENKFKVKEGVKESVRKKEIENRISKLLKIAEKIVAAEDIVTTGNALYMYTGQYYKQISRREIHEIIFNKYAATLSEADRSEIIKFIEIKTSKPFEIMDADYHIINVGNGRLNLLTKQVTPHSPTEFDTIHIDRPYLPETPRSERIEKLFDFYTEGNESKRAVLLEMIGQILMKSNIFQIAYILYGGGNNGKSTLLNIIEKMIGKELCTHVEIGDLKTGFMTNLLQGKLVNLADDISISNINETNILKKLVSGEPITADIKFEMPIVFKNYATLIFATNKLPTSSDKTEGFFRRWVILDFEKQVVNPDRTLLLKINEDDLNYLFNISIDAISNALNKGECTKYEKSDEYKNRYMKEANSVSQFLIDMGHEPESLHKTEISTTYAAYANYCKANGFKQYNSKSFAEEVCAKFGLEVKRTTNKNEVRVNRWVYPGEIGAERVKTIKQGLDYMGQYKE